ncbi:MAG TPA: radical SAM family heme chaperone HemW [Acidobacteriota bacterium]|nr:radical SAM family heme chaperone HemW [Acidobacteriota bacterium]
MSTGAPGPTRGASFGLYVHLPYCRAICPYCAFATAPLRRAEPERLLAALDRETAGAREVAERDADGGAREPAASWRRPRTLYVGGGTPTALDPASLERIVAWLHASFDLSGVREWTVEANPDRLDDATLRLLRAGGADRLSLGVQSMEPAVLKTLGRTHTAEAALDALDRARAAGFRRLSVDLMVAVPGETEVGIAAGAEALLAQGVTHVSAYSLQVEPGTPFAAKVARGALVPPGDDAAADRYALLDGILLAAGFRHYEVSNYARPGEESRHNVGYWNRRPYLGLGPGAHSFDGRTRWANEHDTRRYLERVERDGNARSETTEVGPRDAAEEEIFLALRRERGIRLSRLRALAGPAAEGWTRWGEAAGALRFDPPGRVRPTPLGLLTAHDLAAELLARMGEAPSGESTPRQGFGAPAGGAP